MEQVTPAEPRASIHEVVDDPEAGRKYVFVTAPGGSAPYRLQILAARPDGGTVVLFDSAGDDRTPCWLPYPSWLQNVLDSQRAAAPEEP